MKFTEGGFKLWGYALAEREFPDKTFTWPQYEKIKKEKGEDAAATALLDAEAAGKVVIKDVIADAFLQNTLLVPEEYSVIATLNLNGDYVSDHREPTSTTTAAMRSSKRHMGRHLTSPAKTS